MLPAHLFLLKIIYGKFSFRFQSSFAKSSNSIRIRKNFLQPCSKINALSHFSSVLNPQDKVLTFESGDEITFGEIPFGLSFKNILKKKKHFHCYDIDKYETFLWKRLAYKERIFNHSVKRVYHFLDDEFFFGELFFSDLRKVDDKMIALVLIEKYTGVKNVEVKGNLRINGKGSFIFLENSGINLSIKYINGSSQDVNDKISLITKTDLDSIEFSKPGLEDVL